MVSCGNIKAALDMSAADLIQWLNPKIRGWSNGPIIIGSGE